MTWQRLARRARSRVARTARKARSGLVGSWRRARGRSDTWWDRNPNFYGGREAFLDDEIEGIDHPARRWLRDWLAEHPGLTLLDIPCATGVEFKGFKHYGTPVTYVGMDYTDSMLADARIKHPTGDFRRGDVTAIPTGDNSFDVVLLRHILEHLDDWRPAVTEAFRVAWQHVVIVLFRTPDRVERESLGHGAWDNRIDLNDLLKAISVEAAIVDTQVDLEVGHGLEPNVVLAIRCS